MYRCHIFSSNTIGPPFSLSLSLSLLSGSQIVKVTQVPISSCRLHSSSDLSRLQYEVYIYTASHKKHVTTFSTMTLTTSVRLQKFLAQSVVSQDVIERWFHFPPHLSGATTLPWGCRCVNADHAVSFIANCHASTTPNSYIVRCLVLYCVVRMLQVHVASVIFPRFCSERFSLHALC